MWFKLTAKLPEILHRWINTETLRLITIHVSDGNGFFLDFDSFDCYVPTEPEALAEVERFIACHNSGSAEMMLRIVDKITEIQKNVQEPGLSANDWKAIMIMFGTSLATQDKRIAQYAKRMAGGAK